MLLSNILEINTFATWTTIHFHWTQDINIKLYYQIMRNFIYFNLVSESNFY